MKTLALICLLTAPAFARPPTPRGPLTAQERSQIETFRVASQSVAYITNISVRRDMFSMNVMEVPQGTGSGFVWDTAGHVVTNFHVVDHANELQVTLADRSSFKAQIVGVEPDKDVAVIRIDAKVDSLKPIAIGTSSDLAVGQFAYAIGDPFGLDQTLTVGTISALGREITSVSGHPIGGVIQTDAVINPGNSGGPLLDSAGRLIGMNTAIYSPTGASVGIGFAVPVDSVNRTVEQLIRFGHVVRPSLGVSIAPDSLTQSLGVRGVLILEVEAGGAGERAGLKPTVRDVFGRVELGDVIVQADDKPVKSSLDFYRVLDAHAVGEKVRLGVLRNGRKVTVSAALKVDK
jgi:S1-C subfamily serine protease